MYKDWPQIAKNLSGPMRDLRGGLPDVMHAFSTLAKAATESKALDSKTKELIALAIGVAARCDGCITYHVRAAVDLGASRDEVLETLGVAVYMGGGPSVIYGAQAVEAFDQYIKGRETDGSAAE